MTCLRYIRKGLAALWGFSPGPGSFSGPQVHKGLKGSWIRIGSVYAWMREARFDRSVLTDHLHVIHGQCGGRKVFLHQSL